MDAYKHLISQYGVLVSFNVAKKLNKDLLSKIKKKVKNKCKDKKSYEKMLDVELKKLGLTDVDIASIPGIIYTEHKYPNLLDDEIKIMELSYIATLFSKKILDKKLNKEEICFVIINILNSLNITDIDFKNFHKRYNKDYVDEDDDQDEENDQMF